MRWNETSVDVKSKMPWFLFVWWYFQTYLHAKRKICVDYKCLQKMHLTFLQHSRKKNYRLRVFNSEMHHHRDEIKTTMETLIRKSSDSNWNLWLGIYLAQVCMYRSISSWWREFVLLNASFMLLLENRSRKKGSD